MLFFSSVFSSTQNISLDIWESRLSPVIDIFSVQRPLFGSGGFQETAHHLLYGRVDQIFTCEN